MSADTFAAKPVVVDVNVGHVREILAKARAVLSAAEQECLVGLLDTLLTMTKALHARGATIARMRRLFGLASSEKNANVLGPRAAPTDGRVVGSEGQPANSAPAAETAAATESSPGTSSGEDVPTPDDERGSVPFPATRASCTKPTTDPSAPTNTTSPATTAECTKRPKRKGHGRIPSSAYQNACVSTVPHDLLRAGDRCKLCTRGSLHQYQPLRILRLVGQEPIAAKCWDLERFRCGACGAVFTAPAPAEARGPKCTHDAAAMLAWLRYRVGLPLHRLEKLQHSLGTPLPASTQWECVRDRLPVVHPVFDALFGYAANGRILHTDDTNMPVLEFMGKRREKLGAAGVLEDPGRTGLFTTGVVSVFDEHPIVLFFTGRNHAGENLTELLADRDPSLEPPIHMSDGLDRNQPKDRVVIKAACIAHGRRHVVDEVSNFPEECRHVLEELGQVFQNEVECKKLGLVGQDRLRHHQERSGYVMAALETWMHAQLDDHKIEPNSGLGQALRYLLRRWDHLTLFLRVPDAPLENNLCERILKMAIRHRNNSLFYRSLNGAHVGDVYMSLIHTAELNGENPFEYLVALFTNEAAVAENPSGWLPWTFRASLAAQADHPAGPETARVAAVQPPPLPAAHDAEFAAGGLAVG